MRLLTAAPNQREASAAIVASIALAAEASPTEKSCEAIGGASNERAGLDYSGRMLLYLGRI